LTNKLISIAFEKHNHNECLKKAMGLAEEYCSDHRLNLTPIRRKVLEILLQEHRAIGAYTILEQLRKAGYSSQPPVAYRALDFLVEHRFAHKIERLNAFVACALPGDSHCDNHSPAFMICRQCDTVAETRSVSPDFDISKIAQSTGFKIEQTVIEAEGLCNSCAELEKL
jgi:Fur family zinc uptake transcriptional regulator|tara:strand:- start:862 stop:1368 length:507 start_codon:yes stop_codon:yes gene_type:complete